MAKKSFTFHIADEQKAALKAIREQDGLPEAEQIRRGIQMWLDSRAVQRKAAPRRAGTRRKA